MLTYWLMAWLYGGAVESATRAGTEGREPCGSCYTYARWYNLGMWDVP